MWGSRLLLALVVVALTVIATGVYRAWTSEGTWVTVDTLESVRSDEVTYVEEHTTFVVADDERIVALSAIDPHMGHRDLFCPASKLFEGVHGEKFDRWGTYFAGPAPRGMDRIAVRVEDGVVEIDPTDVTEGPERGDVKPVEPEGPYCGDALLGGRPGFYQEVPD